MNRHLRIGLVFCLGLMALPAAAVTKLEYSLVERLPMPSGLFVQGLEFDADDLLISAGKYGESRLLRLSFPELELMNQQRLSREYFAEGLTVQGERILQLTWRARRGLIYRRSDLRPLGGFDLPGDGWGLCSTADRVFYSDGSATLYQLDPLSLAVTDTVTVTLNGLPQSRLNELECHEGKVWANLWLTDRIVRIDPDSGVIEAELNLSGLYPKAERPEDADVLNGIAIDGASGDLWVTGKYWPWLFRLQVTDPARKSR